MIVHFLSMKARIWLICWPVSLLESETSNVLPPALDQALQFVGDGHAPRIALVGLGMAPLPGRGNGGEVVIGRRAQHVGRADIERLEIVGQRCGEVVRHRGRGQKGRRRKGKNSNIELLHCASPLIDRGMHSPVPLPGRPGLNLPGSPGLVSKAELGPDFFVVLADRRRTGGHQAAFAINTDRRARGADRHVRTRESRSAACRVP